MGMYKGMHTHSNNLKTILNPDLNGRSRTLEKYLEILLNESSGRQCLGHYLPAEDCEDVLDCGNCILYQIEGMHLVRREWLKELLEEDNNE